MSGLLGGGTARQIIVGDEIIRKGSGAPERIEVLVDNAVRLEIQATMARLLNGAQVIQTNPADGATAKAFEQNWLSGVNDATSGAEQDRVTRTIADGTTKRLVRRLRHGPYPIQEWFDDSGVLRSYLANHSSQPELTLIPASGLDAQFTSNFGSGPMALLATQIKLQTAVATTHGFIAPFTNGTGITINAGDVVRLSAAADNTLIATTGAGQSGCLVVVVGVGAGGIGYVGILGKFTVTCTTAGAVARRDLLQSSATAYQAETAAVPVLNTTIGYALTAKAGATPGSVTALVIPSI